MDFLKTVYFWTLMWTYTFFQFIKLIWIYFKHRKASELTRSCAVHAHASHWGEGILKLTHGWSYELRGQHHLPKENDPPYVMVANHQSAVDIWALFTTRAQFRWLSKDAVFRVPLIGQAMSWAGYVPVNRGDANSHQEALDKSAFWLRQGVSMVFFPEGSRSLTGKLKPFKTGAFRLAEEEGVAILPIAIHGTRDMMSKGSIVPRPAKVIVSILSPMQPEIGEKREIFMQRVRSVIEHELNCLDQKQNNSVQSLTESSKVNASY